MNLLVGILNVANNALHLEPIAILVDLTFWLAIFLVGFPLAAVVALIRGLCLFLNYFIGSSNIDPKEKAKQEFAVLITGCDTGFGKELVAPLTARGFTVFCGCLHKESFQQYKDDSGAIPIQLDVTSDKSVAEVYKSVSSWLAAAGTKKKRHFHSLVNNAGIVRAAMIDWAPLSDFKATIDVNYIGMVRCVQTFIPIFQRQAAAGTYMDARIVNMVSMAGLFSGGDGVTPYVASKHAADAFTSNLRLEMSAFGVHVTTVNPTFHQTPMADPDGMHIQLKKVWINLEKKQRDEYGEDFFQTYLRNFDILKWFSWRSKNVVNAMEESVVLKIPPRRLLVGMDAKYIFAPLNLLRTGLGIPAVRVPPAAMMKTHTP